MTLITKEEALKACRAFLEQVRTEPGEITGFMMGYFALDETGSSQNLCAYAEGPVPVIRQLATAIMDETDEAEAAPTDKVTQDTQDFLKKGDLS